MEFAIGYSEPQAGSDAAAIALRATREPDGEGWRLTGQKVFTTSAHFADWYWVGARTDPDKAKHDGISLFLLKMDTPGLEIQAMPTIGDEITNQVFFDNVYVSNDYLVGEHWGAYCDGSYYVTNARIVAGTGVISLGAIYRF